MGVQMKCEACDSTGYARTMRGKWSPDGWYYTEVVKHGREFVIPVCSVPCQTSSWQPILIAPAPCDKCHKPPTEPAHWLYLPVFDEDTGEQQDPSYSPIACSFKCATSIWTHTPDRNPPTP